MARDPGVANAWDSLLISPAFSKTHHSRTGGYVGPTVPNGGLSVFRCLILLLLLDELIHVLLEVTVS